MKKFIGTKEACEFFNTTKPTFDRWCSEGRIPKEITYKIGGKRMFIPAELEALARETAA